MPASDSSPQSHRQRDDRGAPERGERVARVLARAGISSRREAERLIEAGRVSLNGVVLTSPAVNVERSDLLTLDGQPIAEREPARLWRYHKPAGLITTHKDPKGRPTVFDRLPPGMPRVISIGRLDLSSEGLLLLTNDGDLARTLELPATGLVRRYRARAFGRATQEKLDRLKDGITVEGVAYGPIDAHLDGGKGSNIWISLALTEGKNREVRRVLEAIGLKVNRLIRVSYGPFELGALRTGEVEEVRSRQVKALLKGELDAAPEPKKPERRGSTGRSAKPAPNAPRGARQPRPSSPRTASSRPTSSRPTGAKPARSKAAATDTAKPKPTYKAGWARPKRKPKPGKPDRP
ncbi:MAG: pseudouridine synthase [Caulobacteraceae bacterium]